MAWLSGWNYRRKITITNGSGTGVTDYQVKIVLDNSNFDFGKTNADGSDIRFTKDDGQTLLSYWIEEWDDTNKEGKVWVKIPSILANSSTDIYMYYGNSSAEDASNMGDVFVVGCNFDDGSLCGFVDDSQGSSYIEVSSDYSISQPKSLLVNSVANNKRARAVRSFSINENFRYSYWFRPGCNTYINIKDSSGNVLIDGPRYTDRYLKYRDGSTVKTISSASTGTWYKAEVRAYISTHKFDIYINDELKVSGASWTNTGTPVEFRIQSGDSSHHGKTYLDNFFIAKYNSDISYSIGSEELTSQDYVKTLIESSLSISDSKLLSSNPILFNDISISDFSPKNLVKAMIGGIYLNDERKSNVEVLLQKENISTSDNRVINLSHITLEYANAIDKISKSFSVLFRDNSNFTDSCISTTKWKFKFLENPKISDRKKNFSKINFQIHTNINDEKTIKSKKNMEESILTFDDVFKSFNAILKDMLNIFDKYSNVLNKKMLLSEICDINDIRTIHSFSNLLANLNISDIRNIHISKINIKENIIQSDNIFKGMNISFEDDFVVDDEFKTITEWNVNEEEILNLNDKNNKHTSLGELFCSVSLIEFRKRVFMNMHKIEGMNISEKILKDCDIIFDENVNFEDIFSYIISFQRKISEIVNLVESNIFFNILFSRSENATLKDEIRKKMFIAFFEIANINDLFNAFFTHLVELIEKLNIYEIGRISNILMERHERINLIDIIRKNMTIALLEKISSLDAFYGYIKKLVLLIDNISLEDKRKMANIYISKNENVINVDKLIKGTNKKELCEVYLQEKIKKDGLLVKREIPDIHDSKILNVSVPFNEKVVMYWEEIKSVDLPAFENMVFSDSMLKDLSVYLIENPIIEDFIRKILRFTMVFSEKISIEISGGLVREFLLVEKMLINSLLGMRTNVGKRLDENSKIDDEIERKV